MQKRETKTIVATFPEDVLLSSEGERLDDVDHEVIQYALMQNNAVGIVSGYYDERRTISFASHFFLQNLGYRDNDYKQFENQSLLAMIYEEDLYLFEREKFSHTDYEMEFRMRKRDGSISYVHGFKTETADKDGTPRWLLSVRVSKESQNLSMLNEALGTGTWNFDFDEEGRISKITWSEQFARMLGYDDPTVLRGTYEAWMNLIHPADRERIRKIFEDAMKASDTLNYDVEYRTRMKNGTYEWFRVITQATRRIDGKLSHMAGFFINIEKEKKAKRQEEQQEAFHRAYTKSNICEYYVDLKENTFESLKVEDSLLGLFEKSETWDELVKCYVDEYVHEEEKEAVALFLNRRYIMERLPKLTSEMGMECRIFIDGRERWIRNVVMRGSEDKDGIPKHAIMFIRDITDSKKVEEDRRQLIKDKNAIDQLLQRMINLVDRFSVCDLEKNTYEVYSPKKTLDYAPSGRYSEFVQFVSERYRLLTSTDTLEHVFSIENIREKLKEKDDIYRVEYINEREQTIKNTSIVPVEWENGTLSQILIVAQDVTEEKKAEAQTQNALREACEAANRASAAKTQFLSNMSHDIRTPMNAIIGMTAIAGAHIDQKERVMDCLSKITISSRHLLGLINEILDMSRIERGKVLLTEEDFNLSELIDNLVDMIRTDIADHGHDLNIRILNVNHELVCGDSLRIQQIFTNIMSNAIKFTPRGGKITFTMIEKMTHHPRVGCYEFIIEDNGIGMSQQFQEILFDPFSRADNKRETKIQGTGLGMAITKNIVTLMDGDIKVESQLGKGSKFTVTIFLKLQENHDDTIEELENLPVLVVDDDEVACEGAASVLKEIGMKSEWVTSGKEAVQAVTNRHERDDDFFAVIIDWKMPEMDGIETTRQIRKRVGKEVPIIMLSGYDYSEVEIEARAAGVDGFIAKPLFKSRLTTVFRQLVGKETSRNKLANELEEITKSDYSKKRILIVEDNELNREIAVEIIGETGAQIETAQNGKEAVDLVEEKEGGYYDLVFMDIQMPIMNGYEATSAIRSLPNGNGQKLPIVAMTANAFAEDVIMARNVGMNGHMAKPIDIVKLDEILKKWL